MALRCLALAYKPAKGMTAINPLDEAGLTFISMMAMHDPPRHECAAAIETCRQAGIRVVVSGCHAAVDMLSKRAVLPCYVAMIHRDDAMV